MPSWAQQVAAESAAMLPRLGILAHLLMLVLFGVLVPWSKGVDFLDPVTAGAYTCLGVLFAGPAAAAPLLAPGGESGFSAAFSRLLVSILYGEFMAAALLLTGVVTVYSTATLFLLPDLRELAQTALFGLAMTTAVSALAVWINVRFSSGVARMAMRVVFMALLAAFFFYSRWLPDVAIPGTAIAAAAAIVFLTFLWRTSKPQNP